MHWVSVRFYEMGNILLLMLKMYLTTVSASLPFVLPPADTLFSVIQLFRVKKGRHTYMH